MKEEFFNQVLSGEIQEQVEFINQSTPEEIKAMQIIEWMSKQKDYLHVHYYTNELARKFLLEGKVKQVQVLFKKFPHDLRDNTHADKKIIYLLEERYKIEILINVLIEGEEIFKDGFDSVQMQLKSSYLQEEALRTSIDGIFLDCEILLYNSPYKGSVLISDSAHALDHSDVSTLNHLFFL